MDGGTRIDAGETVATGCHYRIRRIAIVPGAQSDLCVDRHRTNHYVVLAGEALITRGDDVIFAGPEASIFVPYGIPHRLKNTGCGVLFLLEVQVGSRGEEDEMQDSRPFRRIASKR
jgi:mannose-6-phosphate isomerase-like protein (cupin superfamily)